MVPDSDAPLLDQLKKLGQEETLPAGALSPAASSASWLQELLERQARWHMAMVQRCPHPRTGAGQRVG